MPSTLYIVGTLYGSVVECLLYVKAKKKSTSYTCESTQESDKKNCGQRYRIEYILEMWT